ncbi:MAG: hypothetical protein WDN28_22040 [Chthoniobacter sp.]
MRTFIRKLLPAVALIFGMVAMCLASPVLYVPDDELVKEPIIVVARWIKSPVERHDLVEEGTLKIWESHTKFEIIRVIKGDVKPGVHPLMAIGFLRWLPDGTGLNGGVTMPALGEVENITEPSIWFLNRWPSWDKKDKTIYLTVGCYRSIQHCRWNRTSLRSPRRIRQKTSSNS